MAIPFDEPDLDAGVIIATLAEGEYVAAITVKIAVEFDGSSSALGLGTPADHETFTGGTMNLDASNMEGAPEANGLIEIPITLANFNGLANAIQVGPEGGIDVLATISDGLGGADDSTDGLVYITLVIVGGYALV